MRNSNSKWLELYFWTVVGKKKVLGSVFRCCRVLLIDFVKLCRRENAPRFSRADARRIRPEPPPPPPPLIDERQERTQRAPNGLGVDISYGQDRVLFFSSNSSSRLSTSYERERLNPADPPLPTLLADDYHRPCDLSLDASSMRVCDGGFFIFRKNSFLLRYPSR